MEPATIPNTNPETRLPYGVIAGNSLRPELLDALYVTALNTAEEAVWNERREYYRKEASRNLDQVGELDVDEWVETQVEAELRDWSPEEPCATIEHEGITLVYSFLGGASLVTSCNGPITHVASRCSPCVPNAADLDSGFGNIKCHGLPLDWYAEKPERYSWWFDGDYCRGVRDNMADIDVVGVVTGYEGQDSTPQVKVEAIAGLLNGGYVKKADVLESLHTARYTDGEFVIDSDVYCGLLRLLEN